MSLQMYKVRRHAAGQRLEWRRRTWKIKQTDRDEVGEAEQGEVR